MSKNLKTKQNYQPDTLIFSTLSLPMIEKALIETENRKGTFLPAEAGLVTSSLPFTF